MYLNRGFRGFPQRGLGGFFSDLVSNPLSVLLAPITVPLAITRATERAIGIESNPLADAIIAGLPSAPLLGPSAPPEIQSVQMTPATTPAPAPATPKPPAPVYYRLNPDGSISTTSTPPRDSSMLPPLPSEWDVASPLSATYVPPESAPAKSAWPTALGLAALFMLGN